MNGKPKIWSISVIFIAAFIFIGLRNDIDICNYTSEQRTTCKVWGLPIFTQVGYGYRDWLEREIGVNNLESNFVDYMEGHPLLIARSTPQGNWLHLRSAKSMYAKYPHIRESIRFVLGGLGNSPLISDSDIGQAIAYLSQSVRIKKKYE